MRSQQDSRALYTACHFYVAEVEEEIEDILNHYGLYAKIQDAEQALSEGREFMTEEDRERLDLRIERLFYEALTLVIMERHGAADPGDAPSS